MNTADFDDAMCVNEVINAKRSAYLDHVYDTERQRLSNKSYSNPQPSTSNPSVDTSVLIKRVSSLENRVNELYSEVVNMRQNRESTSLFAFITHENANVAATNNITLSDQQFKELLKAISK